MIIKTLKNKHLYSIIKMEYKPYCKKIDRSMMDWGFTIPKNYVKDFEAEISLDPGKSRRIEILWEKKRYPAKLCNVKRKDYPKVYQLRWDNSQGFLNKLRKTFIQSYIVFKSQKELFDTQKREGHFRTKEHQEAIVFSPVNSELIHAETFIRVENEWNSLFRRLTEENVFGWIFDKNKKYLISRSTNWIKASEFKEHINATNVIYYLANTKKGLIYVGKAGVLGKRVKPKKSHQDMPDDWDLFKYDIIKQEYCNLLGRIEDHTIRTLAAILENDKGYPTLKLQGYKLVNKNWKKL